MTFQIKPAALLLSCLLAIAGTLEAASWEVLNGCRLKESKSNDGDSFHVEHQGKHYIFRLYFVDAPETGNDFKARTSEQARYFGLRKKELFQLAQSASEFSSEFLGSRFTVKTFWEDAKGQSRQPRYYAIIENDGESLAEKLVENGMARIFGMTPASKWPGGTTPERYWEKLEKLEQDARDKPAGGWQLQALRLAEKAEDPRAKEADEPESERIGPSARLNVNTASASELQEIPGIGPTFAQRIIENRPYKTLDDVAENVSGIGSGRLQNIKAFSYASPIVPLPGSADFVLQNPQVNKTVQVLVDCIRWSGEEAPGGYRALAAMTNVDGQFGGEILVFVKPSVIPGLAKYYGVEEDGETRLMAGRLYEINGKWGITGK